MTAPDARQSDELRELMLRALVAHGVDLAEESADTLLPVVTAWAETQARARAAEELLAAYWATAAITDPEAVREVVKARAADLADDDRTDAR